MKKVMLFILICLFLISNTVFAKGPHSDGASGLKLPGGKWWRIPEIAKKLELTSQDQVDLDSLFVQSRRKLFDLKNIVTKEKFELEQLIEAKTFDESVCMDQFKKLQTARTELATEHFKFVIGVRKLIGKDRFQQLKTMFQERWIDRMKERHGFRCPKKSERRGMNKPKAIPD